MLTHSQHANKQRLATPCTPHSLTFGGHCMNCGHNTPKPAPAPSKAERIERLRALGFVIP